MKKHQIRTIIFTIDLVLSVCAEAVAQRPDFLFDRQFPYEWEYAVTHSLELYNDRGETDGYLVAASNLLMVGYSTREGRLSREVTHPARVYKLSPEGEPLGEMAMNEEGRGSSIIELYNDPNDSKYCLALGRIMDSTHSYAKIFLAKFDLNLNLAWLREIDLPEEYRDLLGGRSLMDSQGDIVFCSWPFNGASMWSHLLYVRLSPEGELEAMGESPFRSWMPQMAQGGLFEYKDGSGDYGQTIVNDNNGSDSDYLLVRMDRDFTVFSPNDLESHIHMTETDGIIINQYYSESFGASMADGTKMVASRGIRYDGWNPGLWDEVIVSMKLDQNDSIVAFSYIPHDNDSVRALAFCQGMDESDGEAFFLCNGVYDRHSWQIGEIGGPNRFVVTKTDANANIIWSRCYGAGGHVFQPCSVVATSDEGCLVMGRYWTTDQTDARAFVVKFFSDGSLSVPEAEAFVRPYTYYPNPAQDQLHLNYSPDVEPAQIELYDLQGRLVRSQGSGLESLSLQGLAPGQYVMKVTMADGTTFSDKVVKE